jgi:hypothetical protein
VLRFAAFEIVLKKYFLPSLNPPDPHPIWTGKIDILVFHPSIWWEGPELFLREEDERPFEGLYVWHPIPHDFTSALIKNQSFVPNLILSHLRGGLEE